MKNVESLHIFFKNEKDNFILFKVVFENQNITNFHNNLAPFVGLIQITKKEKHSLIKLARLYIEMSKHIGGSRIKKEQHSPSTKQ